MEGECLLYKLSSEPYMCAIFISKINKQNFKIVKCFQNRHLFSFQTYSELGASRHAQLLAHLPSVH